MRTKIKCSRCRRRMRRDDGWNCTFKQGVPTGEFLCPDCQTPEENAEAIINDATLDYTVIVNGRWYATPKGVVA